MGENEEKGRDFWIELLNLYDEFIMLGKTDARTIELLEQAGFLREGTLLGQKIMNDFPQLDFKTVEAFVRRGIRDRIVEGLRNVPL